MLTKFKDHADTLLAMLQDKADHVFLLKGGRSRKENEQIREKMKNVPTDESMVLVAIGQYIGEGVNYPRFDTMMLVPPPFPLPGRGTWNSIQEGFTGILLLLTRRLSGMAV